MAAELRKTLLFVDDEPRVLDGLRRTMRAMRGSWDMEFAPSGAEALAILERKNVDVVVTDMRMPEMDGATLLLEITRRYPQVVRIVLSGYSDQEMVVKSIGIAHQYISKPCDAETLRQIVERTGELGDYLSSEPLQLLVAEMSSLPSMPALYHELLDELRSPTACSKRIAEIIEQDIGMTARILQLVNSAFFGLRRQISSAVDAIALLGQDTVGTLAVSTQIFSACSVASVGDLSIEAFWMDSVRTGTLAREIAKTEGSDGPSRQSAFTAGMLRDVGRLVLASQFPERYARATMAARTEGESLISAETAEFGAAHPAVGAYLLGLWGLPDPIVEAVAFHHQPTPSGGPGIAPSSAVHAAECVLSRLGAASALGDDVVAEIALESRFATWLALGERLLSDGGR